MAATYTDNTPNPPNNIIKVFNYTFEALRAEDVKVSLNGVTQATTKYAVDNTSNPTTITFNNTSVDSALQIDTGTYKGAPKTGVAVRVYRQTDVTIPKADFEPGSSVKAADLNNNQKQVRFAIEERQEQENIFAIESKYRVEPGYPSTDNDEGDLVYNTSTDILKVYDGSSWKTVTPTDSQLTDIGVVAGDLGLSSDFGLITATASTATTGNINTVADNIGAVNSYADTYKIAASAPGSPSEGDLWFDTTNDALKVYTGSAWVLSASDSTGSSDVIDEDNFATNSATRPPSQQSVKAYVDALNWLDQSTKQDGSVIYWKNSSSKYFADNAQNTLITDGGNF
jgi:hypothetical protein